VAKRLQNCSEIISPIASPEEASKQEAAAHMPIMPPRSLKFAAGLWPLVLLVCCPVIWAADPPAGQAPAVPLEAHTLEVPYCAVAPKIDGVLDDACWQTARRITDFVQVRPKNAAPPQGAITAYLARGAHALYVAFHVQQAPATIRSYVTKRDDVQSSDSVLIGLDPTGAHQQLNMFQVTPAGVQADGIFTSQNGNIDYSWDTIWTGDGRRTRDGYDVEMAIPFRSLRYNGTGPQTWDFTLVRLGARNNEIDVFPRMSLTEFENDQLAHLEHARLTVDVAPHELAAVPYVGGRFLAQPGRANSYGGRGGADFFYAPTAKISLAGTIFPDFSEVEADQPQIDVNLNQPLFFPEKRPFFTSGTRVFDTAAPTSLGDNGPVGGLFYSRKIVNPQAGLKATGEFGRWQFGALLAQDRAHPGIVGAEDANDAVLRLKRAIHASSYVGFMSTLKSSPQARNQTVGVDADLHLGKRIDWQNAFLVSHTGGQNETAQSVSNTGPDSVHPDLLHSQGYSASTFLVLTTDNFNAYTVGWAISPDFDPQLGFQSYTDQKSVLVGANYHWRINRHGVQQVQINTNHQRAGSYHFGLTQQFDNWNLGASLVGNTHLFFGNSYSRSQWNHVLYPATFTFLSLGTHYLSWLDVNFFTGSGAAINYGDNYLGYSRQFSLRLGTDVRRFHTSLNAQNSSFYRHAGGRKVFSDLAWFWRTEYYLDKRTYLRGILLGSSSDKTLGESLLLRRIISPGTEFYVGLGSNYLRSLEASPANGPAPLLSAPQRRFVLQQRGVFFKFSRRFDFSG